MQDTATFLTQDVTKVDVLDHGFVRLLKPNGNDLSISQHARHLFDTEWRPGTGKGTDERLIRYLMRNRHTSPFEFVDFTFEVKLPIFIARQWMRHRTWSYNEVSARYQELPEEVYIPEAENIGMQSPHNHQGRDLTPNAAADQARATIHDNAQEAFRLYHKMLGDGVPRELARSVLPLGTYTRFSAKVDLHNLLHFLRLRMDEHAQYEIRVYATAMASLIEPHVPVTLAAFHEEG